MKWIALTPEKTQLYKGLAIFMIVTHNFMHWLSGPKEMEFAFHPTKFTLYLQFILAEPLRFVQYNMAYFGHFAVKIFIFLSAYGLTKKFNYHQPRYLSFLKARFKVIYPSFLLAILLWAIVAANIQYGIFGAFKYLYWHIDAVLLKVMLLANFISSERLNLVGPWWFVSFIFQFYIVFPAVFFALKRYGSHSLVIIALLGIILMLLTKGRVASVDLSFTVFGHIPEFALGMYFANKDKNELNVTPYIFWGALVVFMLGNCIESLWYLNHISALVLMLFIYHTLFAMLSTHSWLYRAMLYLGSIALPLFLVNGFLRTPFIEWAERYNNGLVNLTLCAISFFSSVLMAILLKRSVNMLMK